MRQPRQQQRQLILAAAALADDRDMLVERQGKADRVDQPALIVAGERQIGDRQLAGKPRDRLRLGQQELGVEHVGRFELLDDLVVGEPRVLVVLVEVEQLLPRRRQILVRRQHRDQRAERQVAPDHQVAADREEERGELPDKVVEKFDEELAPVNLEPDVVDGAEKMGEVAELQLHGIVGLDLGDPGGGFLNPVGDDAYRADTALAELVHNALQPGDDVALNRVERHRRGAQHRVLNKHEEDDGQQLPALKQRQHERVADEPAELLAFGGDHRDDLRRRCLLEIARREAHQAQIERIAEAPQHPLAELTLQRVDAVFEAAVDEHQREEDPAQRHQIRHLIELEPEERLREALAADRAVDDRLRQVERIVKKRKRYQRKHQQHDLVHISYTHLR